MDVRAVHARGRIHPNGFSEDFNQRLLISTGNSVLCFILLVFAVSEIVVYCNIYITN